MNEYEIVFIEKANKIHNYKYDYSLVNYVNNKKKIIIVCPIHGKFYQSPNNHLRNKGCKLCSNANQSLGIIKFIDRSNIVHNFKFNYSECIFLNLKTNVKIICPIHGSFFQTPETHLLGSGCQNCSIISAAAKRSHTTEEFIKISNEKHNGKYDYSLSVYTGIDDKIKIICPNHGIFEQIAYSHMCGIDCAECKGVKKSNSSEFIQKSNMVHNYTYIYNNVNYIQNKVKVIITCKKHGDFLQTPNAHLRGDGCPTCTIKYSKLENEWLDFIGIDNKFRRFKLPDFRNYVVDGFNPLTNTIYEFYGDYWHGNPKIYKPNDFNKSSKKSFGELYNITINRENKLKNNGYNVHYIWESDWKLLIRKVG